MRNFDSLQKPKNPSSPILQVHNGLPPRPVSFLTKKPVKKRRWLKIAVGLVLVVILVSGGLLLARVANVAGKIFVGQKTTFAEKIRELIRGGGGSQPLVGEDSGQINILLLGIGGEGHDGPYLSDTMILAQIRPDLGSITLTSIPRDYLVTLPDNQGDQKINAAFALGYVQKHDWNQGGEWARQVVEQMSGLTIPYFAVLDFSGFEKAINQVGGVDVTIDNTFTDYSYPDSGTGYLPPITFTKGQEHMDGTRALEFARSRHGNNNEGSDFARSARQQKIIEAFKAKIFSQNLVKSAATINSLLTVFADHFHTNMSPAEIFHLYSLMQNKNLKLQSLSLDPETGLICSEILDSNGAYVLVPCKSQDDVVNFFKNSFAAANLKDEKPVVWLANSTGNKLVYDTAARTLTDAGITVFQLSYTADNLPETIVYQANPKPATLDFLKNVLNATEVNLPPPGVTVSKDRVDLVVVLGQNAPALNPPTPYIPPPARKATSSTETATTTPATTTPATTSKP